MSIQLTYATKNAYKLSSARYALADYDIEIIGIDGNLPDVAEIQSDSQAEVAIDKARKYYELLQHPLIVMDSGLFVESLGGFPGVYTKDVIQKVGAGKIARLLDPGANRAYTQRTVVYFDGTTYHQSSSKVYGELIVTPRGTNGSGYHPYFFVHETGKTMAEMSDQENARLVASAWHDMAKWLMAHTAQ